MKNGKNIQQFITRKTSRIEGNSSRVITRAHIKNSALGISRVIDRVLGLSENEAEHLLHDIYTNFSDRHKNIEQRLLENFEKVSEYVIQDTPISKTKEKLIGAYFTMEYSIESAALFNPSIVPDPDQTGVENGNLRFVMSLRATGEGHISSIVFRSGIIDNSCSFQFDNISQFVETPKMLHDPFYNNHLFQLKLKDMNAWDETSRNILKQIPDLFTYSELKNSIGTLCASPNFKCNDKTINILNWMVNSNYKIQFEDTTQISERVIFPVSENESRGIEDARFVQFQDDNSITYYATYTAYNGHSILPQLIETKDFITFNIFTLNGKAVQNKGMALFPRKIDGKYVMLSRQDDENNHIMFSDNLHFWQHSEIIQEPRMPWEFVKIGNCGSPIEIDEGWLLLTHGVGPMRQYSIGAILLDRENPSKMLARLEEPLLSPNEGEREGYVPNVLYSCGGLVHNSTLILPYGMSDMVSGIATIEIQDLISCMKFV